ncbi:hypothetical protein CNMCM6805_003270 [Aspergillus fumigatiaffinis]|jgi:hypothetical protein|uniref:SUZ domain-containing protein n=1 Tax=Aspergillus fumigatiaffinis TaxID=340414 RepID=A0A8H4EEI7_9EURO|nr:hypothetical protein CNMCM5878_007827 [Aspergillus fumigatiaffinis]KAF4222743.1 hypothetical protein CNMCM6457_001185 [Aspergillus fumigatiaffinis]KAF4227274.1 hypothetical protein CNMCM6805_003270 [Aspergillus fumigatiaffinis]
MTAKPTAGSPDAWEDDWEKQADKLADDPTPPPEKKVSSKVTKAQRRAQQAEFNRQLWAEAESPQTFHYVEARSDVPLKQDFKPAVTVLSRTPQLMTRQSSSSGVSSATAGISRLGLATNDSLEDSDDDQKRPEPTPEERHAIALKNLEEKQRKYEEVRERLFGSPSATTSGASSPRSATPPRQFEGRGKGKSRGNGRDNNRDKRDSSASSTKSKQLFDPGYSSKPNSAYVQKKERQQAGERVLNDQPQSPRQPIRSPRGPDASGRGGFRAGQRGAKAT